MTSRMSLVEQKRLQWAKEREEIARLSEHWNASKPPNPIYPTIRTRISSREHQNSNRKPLRASGHYGSTASLKSLETSSTSLQSLDFSNTSSSMINIHDRTEVPGSIRRRSPSLPPIYTKEHRHHQAYSSQELPNLEVEGSRYINQPRLQKHQNRELDRTILTNSYEEREGETSGYGSDSIEPVIQTADVKRLLPLEKAQGDSEMAQRTWRNPYCDSPDASSLPSSRKFSGTRLGELNRPRWGSIWGQENATSDLPPPPSWLERGLSRLDHSSQVLVINHDSASSPDSSTTGSTGSDSKTYLRGQNIPVDAEILQEREARRQKALELQSAIKQQLEEKDRQRKEERERKLREELEEEERIKRERDKEKERFEEEQRKLKEKENAKLKKEEAMKEILENAERLAKEKKKERRQRDVVNNKTESKDHEKSDWKDSSPTTKSSQSEMKPEEKHNCAEVKTENEILSKKLVESDEKAYNCDDKSHEESKNDDTKESLMRLNREVAIVLTGRLEDSNCLQGTNVQLLNLIVNPNLHQENNSSGVNINFNALIKSLTTSGVLRNTSGASISPRLVENRLLTPSKYRIPSGRDFGTQTDVENEIHELGNKENCKERKDVSNNRRDVEKSMNMAIEEKNLSRSKSQPRTSLESRPRWNANRPGTRYRTQSEKDPHYQRRMRLRRRRVESSDERSRSPSPDRRKITNIKSKIRNPIHRKSKLDNYDADMSMDSLNSVVPLRVNEHGQIIVQTDTTTNNSRLIGNCRSEDDVKGIEFNEKNKMWCGQEILSQLNSLKNLDDLLRDDKRDANLIPDLSKATCNSQEEFRRLRERCPEYKIKPERVKREDIKVRDKDFSWTTTRKELKAMEREWGYGDPIPPDMKSLNLQELQQVAIDWRMLTPLRPKLRADEEMFSRMVEMGKMEIKTLAKERRVSVSPIRRSKTRAGIIESSVKICGDCGEEFCFGEACGDILYDSFIRVTVIPTQQKIKVSEDTAAIIANMNGSKGKKKKKGDKSTRGKVVVPVKKSTRLVAKGKRRKTKSSETKESSGKNGDKNDAISKAKKFKRKCSKYSKKGRLTPK